MKVSIKSGRSAISIKTPEQFGMIVKSDIRDIRDRGVIVRTGNIKAD